MKTRKVAVIILNWNGLSDTIECLNSLYKNTWKNFSVYVVDNASKENEGNAIELKFPNVKILKQNENFGFCKGNNIAIQRAIQDGTEYLLLLNNDTLTSVNLIEKLVETFEKLPNAGAICPLI